MPFDLPPADPGIEIVLASRGISKGLAQTEGPQLLVRPEVAFGPVYVSAYGKNVTSETLDGEAGTTLGVRTSAGGFDLGASATYKFNYATEGPGDFEAWEFAASASRRMGPVTARASLVWSPDDLGSTGRSAFAEGQLSYSLGSGRSLVGAVGRREREGGADYTAFNAGVAQTFADHFTAEVRWYDTDRSNLGFPYRGRLVASLRARF